MPEHSRKIGTVKTIDAETGEVVSVKKNAFTMLPTKDGVCPECGTDHKYDMPHNVQSMVYQYRFYGTHGRWPTHTDSMQHCTDEMKSQWREAVIETLKKIGKPIPDDLLEQKPAGK